MFRGYSTHIVRNLYSPPFGQSSEPLITVCFGKSHISTYFNNILLRDHWEPEFQNTLIQQFKYCSLQDNCVELRLHFVFNIYVPKNVPNWQFFRRFWALLLLYNPIKLAQAEFFCYINNLCVLTKEIGNLKTNNWSIWGIKVYLCSHFSSVSSLALV